MGLRGRGVLRRDEEDAPGTPPAHVQTHVLQPAMAAVMLQEGVPQLLLRRRRQRRRGGPRGSYQKQRCHPFGMSFGPRTRTHAGCEGPKSSVGVDRWPRDRDDGRPAVPPEAQPDSRCPGREDVGRGLPPGRSGWGRTSRVPMAASGRFRGACIRPLRSDFSSPAVPSGPARPFRFCHCIGRPFRAAERGRPAAGQGSRTAPGGRCLDRAAGERPCGARASRFRGLPDPAAGCRTGAGEDVQCRQSGVQVCWGH